MLKKTDKWRLAFLGILMVAGFAMLVFSLADLQVRPQEEYGAIAESTMTKTITERGTRGQILDANGTLLAYDKKIYNVEFYRDPSSGQAQNGEYSKAIWEVIKILEQEGKAVNFDFWLKMNDDGLWEFDTKTDDEGVQEAREQMFRSNFYVKSYDTQDIFDRLSSNYMINEIDVDYPASEKLTLEDKLKVLSVWQEMQMNAFNSVPIVLATDVKWSTVIEVETRLVSLPGMSVSVENQRVYPKGTLACHILGYTGLMHSQGQVEEYLGQGYQRDDMIGLDGVEKSMEQYLTGNSSLRRGYQVVEVDRSGRKIRELSREDPVDGNTVKLTIDSNLQSVVEKSLSDVITYIRDQQEERFERGAWLEANKDELTDYENNDQDIKLAQNGAIVVLDMNARVLAMASHPNYDPNLFIIGMDEAQTERMLLDERNPLFNNAIGAKDTPGSVFKMATALAAMANGELTVSEEISDGGLYTLYDTVNPPQCWIGINQISQHSNQTIVEGLSHSCNYFFYTIATRLGPDGERLYNYAAKLGLTSKTNVDLPGEVKSVVGSQASMYDPSKPINGFDQATWLPVQVKAALKDHLKRIGEMYSITYSEERLDKCIKALMDMAENTNQGEGQQDWVRAIRPILMEELGMSMDMVYRQVVVGDLVNYLNEIKWGGTNTIMTAIGQSITLTTPIAMARYIVAVANGGYVYDVQLIDSIISPEGEVLNSFDEPVLVNDLSAEVGEFLPYIHQGMHGVVDESGTAKRYFEGWKYLDDIAGKTGTAEKSELDVESNSWFVAFAPYDEPEIAVVVYVPYGLSGAMSSRAAKEIIEYYLDAKIEDESYIAPAVNGLAQ